MTNKICYFQIICDFLKLNLLILRKSYKMQIESPFLHQFFKKYLVSFS